MYICFCVENLIHIGVGGEWIPVRERKFEEIICIPVNLIIHVCLEHVQFFPHFSFSPMTNITVILI